MCTSVHRAASLRQRSSTLAASTSQPRLMRVQKNTQSIGFFFAGGKHLGDIPGPADVLHEEEHASLVADLLADVIQTDALLLVRCDVQRHVRLDGENLDERSEDVALQGDELLPGLPGKLDVHAGRASDQRLGGGEGGVGIVFSGLVDRNGLGGGLVVRMEPGSILVVKMGPGGALAGFNAARHAADRRRKSVLHNVASIETFPNHSLP